MKEFIKKAICFIIGHKITYGLYEDDYIISGKYCSRCNCAFAPWQWKMTGCPRPPMRGETKEQAKLDWEEYCECKYEKLRKMYSKQNQ